MPARIPPVQYCSPEDAARVLRVNINSLYRAIRSKEFPAVCIGREYRIPLEALGITPEPVEMRAGMQLIGQLLLDLRW